MTSDTVQSALEAIDGYLADIVSGSVFTPSFQDVYNASCPNPEIYLTCGPLTIQGPGSLDINTTTNITEEVTITGGGPVIIDVSGNVIIDGYNVSITSTNTSTINGEHGVILDGYGYNVIPFASCTDSLGDPTHGWTDIYICNNGDVIGIKDAGSASAPNTLSGAEIVGTNSLDFGTFGPEMTGNTVQAALEAIDGYLATLNLNNFDTTYTEVRSVDINGAVLNGIIKVATDGGTPALDFKWNAIGRASWTIPVPTDWDGVSDFHVSVIWSPESSVVNNVEWRLEYKSLSLTELVSSAVSTSDYLQATGGTADGLQSTGNNLTIPASAVSTSDDLIVINIVRRGTAGTDTYHDNAQVHLVKYSYKAQNIV
jgi:hypothetical protein